MNELIKFKIAVFVFVVAAVMLLILNISVRKEKFSISTKSVSSENVGKIIKTYGYSEILDIVTKNEKVKILKMSSSNENKELLKLEIQYYGNLRDMYDALHDFSSHECFHSVEIMKVDYGLDNQQIIYATILFLRSK